ncbi:GTP 3',8-cyclase MoaA [Paenibacillus sp. HN-1]|uniref:GTP 3',8-cyclase MoaA n=1 Tax=Paenibacillus sp. CGMCC 1.18879 TaxID=2834466 RepID=UPI001CA92E85|nr:GTP 3',8-cyclase MoaA [Paenibacillus sp. CGMCC 1.18879]MBY9078461.1 GTP 3',8-cyclase MoaA [Paenibacillus sp. CGMCC 1.18879]MBY9082754.1 GTP 3',8-cyclase MoaA [Paenibacillus sinensis]
MTDRLVDSFGRVHNYVRISVTDLCNLGCQYCRPGSSLGCKVKSELLSFDQLAALVEVLAHMGVTKVRLTGGEPLLRPRLEALIGRLSRIKGISQIGLTTNGMLLGPRASLLRQAGLTDVNISIDSLVPERYAGITGGGDFNRVIKSIESSCKAGFDKVKLNVVLMHGVNDDEIEAFLKLTVNYPLFIRFIEYMPIGDRIQDWRSEYMPAESILMRCEEKGWQIEPAGGSGSTGSTGGLKDELQEEHEISGPARYYRIAGAAGEFGLISPVSRHFCGSCNRLRITANGCVKPCLYWNEEWDLKPYIGDEEGLRRILLQSLASKPLRHEMTIVPKDIASQPYTLRQMSQIGG